MAIKYVVSKFTAYNFSTLSTKANFHGITHENNTIIRKIYLYIYIFLYIEN